MAKEYAILGSAMTSYAMVGDQEKLLVAGYNGYIEKPKLIGLPIFVPPI